MAEEEPDRNQGINMEDIDALLENVTYPVTANELVERHGERTIERTNADSITLQELLEPLDDETFETPDDVNQILMSLMPTESVGREEYSDRGGSVPEESPEAEAIDDEESL
jgi:hypothetical protein